MDTVQIDTPLVEVDWLREHLEQDNLVVLDATLPKAVSNHTTKDPRTMRIPGARFFDIKNIFSDALAVYPNTWPGESTFIEAAQNLGIHKNSGMGLKKFPSHQHWLTMVFLHRHQLKLHPS